MKGRGIEHSRTVLRSRRKSSGNLPNREIKRKGRLITKIMTRNCEEKLSAEIITEIIRGNYDAKLRPSILCRVKCGNYRDTGVSKNALAF